MGEAGWRFFFVRVEKLIRVLSFLIVLCSSTFCFSATCNHLFLENPARLPRGFWKDKQNIYQLVEVLSVYRKNLFLHELATDPLTEVQAAFVEEFGAPIPGHKINNTLRVYRMTDAWAEGLSRVGHPRSIEEKKKQQVLRVLQIRLVKGMGTAQVEIKKDQSLRAKAIYRLVYGEVITGQAFVQRAKKLSSWSDWMERLGQDADLSAARISFINYAQVQRALQALLRSDVRMDWSSLNMRFNESPEAMAVIEAAIGRRLTVKQVFRAAIRVQTWVEWQLALGLDPKKVSQGSLDLSDEQVLSALSELLNASPPVALHSKVAEQDASYRARVLIYRAIGFNVPLKKLYFHAVGRKPWREWFEQLGMDYRNIAKSVFLIEDHEILSVIQALSSARPKIALNMIAVKGNRDLRARRIIKRTIGLDVDLARIYNSAKLRAPWYRWISDAGLDVTEIQLSGSIPFQFVNEITRSSLRGADSNRRALLGEADLGFESDGSGGTSLIRVEENSSEDILMQTEFHDRFQGFQARLDPQSALLLEAILDHLEQGASLAMLMNEGLNYRGNLFTPESISDLFSVVREDEELLALFTQ